MVDQSPYWKRVELAAKVYLAWAGATIVRTATQYTVLPTDLRKRVLEMEEEQDGREK